jgi:hypothetical protein
LTSQRSRSFWPFRPSTDEVARFKTPVSPPKYRLGWRTRTLDGLGIKSDLLTCSFLSRIVVNFCYLMIGMCCVFRSLVSWTHRDHTDSISVTAVEDAVPPSLCINVLLIG